MDGVTILGGGKKEDRNESDFYPTPPEATIALLDYFDFLSNGIKTVDEVCCGDGAISKILVERGFDVYSSDLRYSGYGEGGINYLLAESRRPDMIFTNPPFNIAEEIIYKAMEDARYIVCMLLKSQYWHAKGRLKLFNKYTPAYVMPLTWRPNFGMGDAPVMDVQWTVWIKGVNTCIYQPLNKPKLNTNQKELF